MESLRSHEASMSALVALLGGLIVAAGCIQFSGGEPKVGPSGGGTEGWISVWGSSASDVWVVGSVGTVLHWNGSSWSTARTGTGSQLTGVWSTSASDAWAVGSAGTILHWNGSAWSNVASGTTAGLDGVVRVPKIV